MGKDYLQTFLNLNISVKYKNNVQACMNKMENYFKLQCHVVYERYVFNICEQVQEESVDSYITSLRKLALSCEFGMLTDEFKSVTVWSLLLLTGEQKENFCKRKLSRWTKQLTLHILKKITSKQLLESMKSDTTSPLKVTVNLAEKRKSKDFKKQPSGKPKQGKNCFPNRKKLTENRKCNNCGTQHK